MFDPAYLSPINGDLGTTPYLGEPRYFSYLTKDNISKVGEVGYFPDNCGLQIGDLIRVITVDEYDLRYRTTADVNLLVVTNYFDGFLITADSTQVSMDSTHWTADSTMQRVAVR